MSAWTHTRSRLALEYHSAKSRNEVPDPGRIAQLQQQLRAERVQDYLERQVLGADPALSASQLTSLAAVLLRAAGRAGGDHVPAA